MMDNTSAQPFQRVTIIGVGLIGGSLALAIKHRFPSIVITDVDKPAVLKRALERKAIDNGERNIERAVAAADLVVLATPVSAIANLFPVIARACSHDCIITDTGSVKLSITTQAQRFFPGGNFIGGHPMTGAEFSGIEAAHPLLFQNALYILTPNSKSKKLLIRRLASFLIELDARIIMLDPATHDGVTAAVSHLPQLAAVALMNTIGMEHKQSSKHLALAAGGLRDMTRIASSKFDIWNDILYANQKEIGLALNLYIRQLQTLSRKLQRQPSKLKSDFKSSRALRARIPRSMKGFLSPLIEVPVYIEDKPGELARLTSALANAQINIKDMELIKVREGRGGTFRFSFENQLVASEATRLLQALGFGVGHKNG
jgi:prephenate dehydrogenase